VEETILLSFFLVVLDIFIFLRNWRTTLIPIIAIPISLIGTLFCNVYLWLYNKHTKTLLGVVLATGIVVDDAIVVMENIYSKIEHGMDNFKQDILAVRKYFRHHFNNHITLVAVFMPIVFLQGIYRTTFP
jgi:multidrug efflux pump